MSGRQLRYQGSEIPETGEYWDHDRSCTLSSPLDQEYLSYIDKDGSCGKQAQRSLLEQQLSSGGVQK